MLALAVAVDDDGDGSRNEGVQSDVRRPRGFGHADAPSEDGILLHVEPPP